MSREKLLHEFETIRETEWWRTYCQILDETKKTKIKFLITETDKEKLPSIQSAIRTIKWVEEDLPKSVLEFKEK